MSPVTQLLLFAVGVGLALVLVADNVRERSPDAADLIDDSAFGLIVATAFLVLVLP